MDIYTQWENIKRSSAAIWLGTETQLHGGLSSPTSDASQHPVCEKEVTASHHVVKVRSYREGISPLGFALTPAIRLSLLYSFLSKNNGAVWWSACWLDVQALLWNHLMGKLKKETSGPYGTASPSKLAAPMIQDDTASTFQHSHLISQ